MTTILDDTRLSAWEEWQTGGNCTAARLTIDESNYALLTAVADCTTPSTIGDRCWLGLYRTDETDTEHWAVFECESVLEALTIVRAYDPWWSGSGPPGPYAAYGREDIEDMRDRSPDYVEG